MARVITEEQPRDTVVVERETDREVRGSNAGVIVAVVIVLLLLLLLMVGNPFNGGSGSTDVDVNVPTTNPAP